MWFPMILSLVTRNPKRPSILPPTRGSRRGPAHRRRPILRPYLEALEHRLVPSSITVLASHLHTDAGRPEQVRVAETDTQAQGNDFTFNATPGVYHLTEYNGFYVYGSFTVATDGTISGTTGALVASGGMIDFDVSKLAAVTIFGTDLQTAAGSQEALQVQVVSFSIAGPATDTVYLPAGTFPVTDGYPHGAYGSVTVAANGSGALAVTGASGAAVATGNTIRFDVTKLAAVTIVGTDLKTAAGSQQTVAVGDTVSVYPGAATDTVYLPAGTYPVVARTNDAYGSVTVAATGSGALAVTGASGAAVATGNTIRFDVTKLAAVTIVGTDLKTAAGSQQAAVLSNIVSLLPSAAPTDTVYLPAGTFLVTDASGTHIYASVTVAANGLGALAVTGASGSAVATGNTIHFDLCRLDRVQITPNLGVSWYVDNVIGTSYASDVVALPDGSYTLSLNGPSGFTSATFSVSSSGLSVTQLPQGAPLATLALVPCVPVVGPITAPSAPVPVNTVVAASASFTDPDARETHTAVWNWGDGSTSAGAVTESNGAGSVSGSHTYAADGVYTLALTVTDDDGASGQSTFSYLVVYNPAAGFTTGGGWFNSPAGAYPANPSLTGKANFGFNAKYKAGASVPTGDTEYQLPAASLNFHSTGYDWLVVSGSQAQFQGSGTIYGAGSYGFLVTALDNGGGGTPDRLRLKIWDKNNSNAVVYDTQPGAATTAAPTTPLGGGRIQVHAGPNGLQLAGGGPAPEPVPLLTAAELAPVVQEAKAEWRVTGLDAAQWAALDRGAVYVTSLPAPYLGLAAPGSAWINVTAAGLPWFLDPSPAADALFAAGLVRGQVDLLTVVAHELGHVLGLDYEEGDGIMTGSLAAGVRLQPQARDLLGPQAVSGTALPTSGTLPAATPPASAATPVTASRNPGGSPALAGAAGGTEGLFLFPADVSLAGEPGVAPSPESAVVPSLAGADAPLAPMPLADWAGGSALGYGHARRDTAAGDPGGADAEEGLDVDSVDRFFSRLEGDALWEDVS